MVSLPPQPRHKVTFGQVYVSRVIHKEEDGNPTPMFPNDARLRNLTYWGQVCTHIEGQLLGYVARRRSHCA